MQTADSLHGSEKCDFSFEVPLSIAALNQLSANSVYPPVRLKKTVYRAHRIVHGGRGWYNANNPRIDRGLEINCIASPLNFTLSLVVVNWITIWLEKMAVVVNCLTTALPSLPPATTTSERERKLWCRRLY
jgi:hypothetical protein